MRATSSTFLSFLVVLTLTGLLFQTRGATPALTVPEQEVIEALFREDVVGQVSKRLIVEDMASIRGLRFGDSFEKFAADLRERARARDRAFKEALEDFLRKNKQDTKIAFPTNAPAKVELVSEATVKEIFSAKHDAKSNGWDRFYQRFPGSSGLVSISRVGIDSKGTIAIVYLGNQSHYLAGGGHIRVMKREGKKWKLSYESIGPQWVS
jgi:hypothetical protein